MNGLYALKPWYADRLAGARAALVRRQVSPDALTWAGVLCAGAAAVALGLLPARWSALPVAVLLAARLAEGEVASRAADGSLESLKGIGPKTA
ncbi:hypothetical protein ABT367_17930, partial [Streptomyces mesophilus]